MKALLVNLGIVTLHLLICVSNGFEHICAHDNVAQLIEDTYNPLEYTIKDHSRIEKRGLYQPIRIFLDTTRLNPSSPSDLGYSCYFNVSPVIKASDGSSYTCIQEDIITSAKALFLLQTVLPQAIALLTQTYSVVPVQVLTDISTSISNLRD
jgi:hypothetical protein